MKHFTKTDSATKDGFIHVYENIDAYALENRVHELMLGRGYKLKDGENGNGTYIRGIHVVRILLGAFYNYFNWQIHVQSIGKIATVELSKKSSGMSGGVIGINQVKTELQFVSNMLKII